MMVDNTPKRLTPNAQPSQNNVARNEPKDSSSARDSGLFRRQVVDKTLSLDGEIIVKQPIGFTLLTILFALLLLTLVMFLISQEYTRKTRVYGYLQPTQGLVESFAEHAGTVSHVTVKEGDKVNAGDVLFVVEQKRLSAQAIGVSSGGISNGSANEVLQDANIGQIEAIQNQISQLDAERNNQQQRYKTSKQSLHIKQQQTASLRGTIDKQYSALQQRITLAQRQFQNGKQLLAQGHIADEQVVRLQQSVLLLQQQAYELEQLQLQTDSEQQQASQQLQQLEYQHASDVHALLQQQQQLQRQLSNAKFQYQYTVVAQISGQVTNLKYKVGQSVVAGSSLLTIVPENSQMEAVLLVPTRGFGFINQGQVAKLKYQAFPYQQFGSYQGRVRKLGNAVLTKADSHMPIAINEPVYKVTVALESQSVQAYGKAITLSPGMLLQADIEVDKRSLLDWLLEPIYSLKGRI
ncbi:HlyD family efflux transporter periplasmic adaptor subunit [Thalassotalea sp. HSM 43]|uniref:HlyD family efflux transporter periplasmic adaptor subunit n=1 Tax=Thalassotalea sp. HSM 43 TaxID=2552945 RepID=UPI00107FE066|nr:HlyD family efflux transporter periplasmic adaptor subunit [Thalassotalea sp. HSM 43]QBY03093.1 HlyD family efflux transporter periplasmic adaptor subunit [Thalassotalea sp. HSM 43]